MKKIRVLGHPANLIPDVSVRANYSSAGELISIEMDGEASIRCE